MFSASPMFRNMGSESGMPAKEVKPGDPLVRTCGIQAPHFPLNTNLDTIVTYSYPLLGTQKQTTHFESLMDSQGIPQWFKTVE